jgi:hypothetical protein
LQVRGLINVCELLEAGSNPIGVASLAAENQMNFSAVFSFRGAAVAQLSPKCDSYCIAFGVGIRVRVAERRLDGAMSRELENDVELFVIFGSRNDVAQKIRFNRIANVTF